MSGRQFMTETLQGLLEFARMLLVMSLLLVWVVVLTGALLVAARYLDNRYGHLLDAEPCCECAP